MRDAQGRWLRLRVLHAQLRLSEESDAPDPAAFLDFLSTSGYAVGHRRKGSVRLPWARRERCEPGHLMP